jgi:Vta1 like
MKSRGPKFDGVLRALIAKLERDKPAAGLGDGDKEYCRNFAESIFARADKIDRAGRADKSTCLTFYAATIFIEVGWHAVCIWIPSPLLADAAQLPNTTLYHKACAMVPCRF